MAKKLSDSAFTAQEAAEFTAEIRVEAKRGSDRALILVSTAVLDEALRRTLQSFMIDTAVSRDLLASSAPLGTMSSRIQISEALGLITPQESKCLHMIRVVRNEYAHEIGAAINLNSIADRVENLRNAANALANDGEIPKAWSFRLVISAACINMISILTLRLQRGEAGRRTVTGPVVLERLQVDFSRS